MTFGEKIKAERENRKMNHKDFAKLIGISTRILSAYENGKSFPRTRNDYTRIANTLNLNVNYLLTDNDEFIMQVGSQYGYRAAHGANKILEDVRALFSGGEMAPEDMDELMLKIQETYWEVKRKNHEKFTPKKYHDEK